MVCDAELSRLKLEGLALTPEGSPVTLHPANELNPPAGTSFTVRLWLALAVSVSELAERVRVKLGLPPPPPDEEPPPPQLTSAASSVRQKETKTAHRGNALAFIDSF